VGEILISVNVKPSHFAVKTGCTDRHGAYIVALESSHTDMSCLFKLQHI